MAHKQLRCHMPVCLIFLPPPGIPQLSIWLLEGVPPPQRRRSIPPSSNAHHIIYRIILRAAPSYASSGSILLAFSAQIAL